MANQPHEPSTALDEALRTRLREESDVLAAYVVESRAEGAAGVVARIDVGVLLDAGPDPEQRRPELRAAVRALADPCAAELVVLNRAPADTAYHVIADGRLVLSRDDRCRARHQAQTIERYFDMASLRRMLATGLRHRLGESGR
jgi:predicted nucleotidyltransferase